MSKVFVTKPSLPPLEEFIPYLERIWENKIITNNDDFHRFFNLSWIINLNSDFC